MPVKRGLLVELDLQELQCAAGIEPLVELSDLKRPPSRAQGSFSASLATGRDSRMGHQTLVVRQSFPVGTTVAGSTISTTVRPWACGRCTMPRGIVTP